MLEQIDISKIIAIAKEAGKIILEVYNQPIAVEKKADHSPITLADKRSNDIITTSIQKLYPEIPLLSEESKQIPYDKRKHWDHFWLIDPLDGTKEFINKNGEFTVNIALIQNGEPVLGVVYIPVTNTTYYASKKTGSFKILPDETNVSLGKQESYHNKPSVKVVASRSHLTDEVKQFIKEQQSKGKEVDFISAGSSLKFCLVAEGTADVYPRFGPTMEWDTAAAQIVATEAGRKVLNEKTRQPLIYNKENLLNPWFIVE